MADIKQLLDQLNSSVRELVSQIHDLDDQIDAKQRERDQVINAPLSKADYLSFVGEDIDRIARPFVEQLRRAVKSQPQDMIRLRRMVDSEDGMRIPWFSAGYFPPIEIAPTAVCWYFGDLIKQRIADALDGQDWPHDAMPVAERLKLTAQLEVEIEELNRQRDALAAQLEESGLKG
ncbi:MAG: hypothetical protein EPN21_00495 [Methylococcaceae bacterium]|nr:MAG: hypothetical protein EPN21_00495 [Methylococcaceae bacterium]